MHLRQVAILGVLLGVPLLAAKSIRAESPIFVWVDKGGNLHATDRLQDVPEPYFAMYTAQLKESAKNLANAPSEPVSAPYRPAGAAPPASNPALDDAKKRQEWRALMAQWRHELAAATLNLQKVDRDLADTEANPVLRLNPQNRSRADELMHLRMQAAFRVEQARHMLMDELPRRARVEQVPPLWLM